MNAVLKNLTTPIYYRKPPLTWDVESWLAQNSIGSAKITEIFVEEGKKPDFPKPSSVTQKSQQIAFPMLWGTFRRYLAIIQNATINGYNGLISMPGGTFLIQPHWVPEVVTKDPSYFKRIQPTKRVMRGKYFSLMLYHVRSYYHWICEVLPLLHDIIERLPEDVRFIVPEDLDTWAYFALEAVGVEKSRCITYDGKQPWMLEKLFYAPPVAMPGNHDRMAMKWVRRSIVSAMQEVAGKRDCLGKRLFISRAGSPASRHISNEVELHPVLEKYGYNIIFPEQLSFPEQIAIFSVATHIIGPHGGGMTNMTWAPERCRIMEIFHPLTIDRSCYWSLASTMGHYYTYLIGNDQGQTDPNTPFSIHPDDFEEALAVIKE